MSDALLASSRPGVERHASVSDFTSAPTLINATQASNRPQFWHGKKNGLPKPLGVYDPNISAKSIAGKLAVGSVTP
jgi:hypothetical protein